MKLPEFDVAVVTIFMLSVIVLFWAGVFHVIRLILVALGAISP